MRLCARTGCSHAAVATVGFDTERALVCIDRIGATRGRAAGDVCEHHAGTLSAPRGWQVLDLREDAPALLRDRDVRSDRNPPAIDRSAARVVRPVRVPTPHVQSHELPFATSAPAASTSWSPHFDRDDDVGGLLRAHTPLLARAFGFDG